MVVLLFLNERNSFLNDKPDESVLSLIQKGRNDRIIEWHVFKESF